MQLVSEHLKSLPFWDKLSESEKKFVAGNAMTRDFKRGSSLMGSGDSCLGMVYVISGNIRVHIISVDGREISLFRIGHGDACVLSASCVMSQITFETSMTVEEDSRLLIIEAGAFDRLSEENVHVRCFSYELAAERFSQVMWVLQQIVFNRFDERLASFLVKESDKSRNGEILMTQESIAKEVNSAREVVTRMLRKFSEEGYVELERGRIVIRDRQALENLCKM